MKEAIDMGKKIMVVDDSRMIALQMQNLLEDTEYEIAAYCRNGEDALAKYGEIRPDIVTMDIIMPGMDGLETAQALLWAETKLDKHGAGCGRSVLATVSALCRREKHF